MVAPFGRTFFGHSFPRLSIAKCIMYQFHLVERWQSGSRLVCHYEGAWFNSLSDTEIAFLHLTCSQKVTAQFSLSVQANVSSILNVQFSDVENSWCACGFCATIRMCKYPNVQVSSCACSRMGKIPFASFRCASPRCAFLLAPLFSLKLLF